MALMKVSSEMLAWARRALRENDEWVLGLIST